MVEEREQRERGRGRKRNERERENNNRDEESSDLVDKLVGINRVAKTVKGGKNFGFAALVVVGDQKGRAGFGKGKAREVPEAIRKATEEAKRNLVRVPLREGRTLHHDGRGRHGAGKVVLRAAPPGTGVIAGGPMRAVMEVLGVQDVVGKSIGSSNPYNMVRATFDALKTQASPRTVASKRGLKVQDVVGRRTDGASDAAAIDSAN
jgi:small subunit ribosomal protein S5